MKQSVRRHSCSGLLLALSLLTQAALADDFKSYDELKQGMPAEVSELLARIGGCNHWSGESPYDEARGAEIREALQDLRCQALPKDIQDLLKRYGAQSEVARRIAAAQHMEF